jgi:hypothetical protein
MQRGKLGRDRVREGRENRTLDGGTRRRRRIRELVVLVRPYPQPKRGEFADGVLGDGYVQKSQYLRPLRAGRTRDQGLDLRTVPERKGSRNRG